jgi:hypothetical protein
MTPGASWRLARVMPSVKLRFVHHQRYDQQQVHQASGDMQTKTREPQKSEEQQERSKAWESPLLCYEHLKM